MNPRRLYRIFGAPDCHSVVRETESPEGLPDLSPEPLDDGVGQKEIACSGVILVSVGANQEHPRAYRTIQ